MCIKYDRAHLSAHKTRSHTSSSAQVHFKHTSSAPEKSSVNPPIDRKSPIRLSKSDLRPVSSVYVRLRELRLKSFIVYRTQSDF